MSQTNHASPWLPEGCGHCRAGSRQRCLHQRCCSGRAGSETDIVVVGRICRHVRGVEAADAGARLSSSRRALMVAATPSSAAGMPSSPAPPCRSASGLRTIPIGSSRIRWNTASIGLSPSSCVPSWTTAPPARSGWRTWASSGPRPCARTSATVPTVGTGLPPLSTTSAVTRPSPASPSGPCCSALPRSAAFLCSSTTR